MSLLNAALAFGAFAFSIPLIIHLFFRSRYKTVDWGAMYLLESVIKVNRRRMQVTNLLLLLLRCLIPVILAFCLARPVWTAMRSLAGDAPKTLVVAIDDSRSLSVTPPGQISRIEDAKNQIRSVLETLSRRDEIIFVRSSRLGAVPSIMGASDALATLRRIDARGDATSLGALLDAAVSAADQGTHSRRQVLVVSDFQSSTLDAESLDRARVLADTAGLQIESGSSPIVFDFLDVGGAWNDLANVSIDDVSMQSPVVVSKRAGVYTATIRNASDLPANDLRLVWSIDGTALEPRVISVDAKSIATNRLTHTIDQSGMYEVSATISRSDVLLDDNRRSVAVEVMDQINVLLVEGQPSKQPLGGHADFLAIALSPFAFGGDDRPDPVRSSVISARRIESALEQNDVQVVMLCGVSRLSDSAEAKLVDFVHQGGSLVTFDSPDVGSDFYNVPWVGSVLTDGPSPSIDDQTGQSQRANSAGETVRLNFPARAGDYRFSSGGNGSDSTSGDTTGIQKPTEMYGPWQILSRGEENPFSEVNLRSYREVTLSESGELSAGAVEDDGGESQSLTDADRYVLLKTVDGNPLVVMASVGSGSLVQVAFAFNNDESNLPLRPVFLPMVQQLVLDLAGKRDDKMIGVGQPIVIHPTDWPKINDDEVQPRRIVYSARTPYGVLPVATPPETEPIRLTNTYVPGAYRIQKRVSVTPTQSASSPNAEQIFETMRIAAVDPSESLLVGATQERKESLATILDAKIFSNASDLSASDRSRSFGREIWRWLLALLIVALVLELWLQQNLIRRRAESGGLQ